MPRRARESALLALRVASERGEVVEDPVLHGRTDHLLRLPGSSARGKRGIHVREVAVSLVGRAAKAAADDVAALRADRLRGLDASGRVVSPNLLNRALALLLADRVGDEPG